MTALLIDVETTRHGGSVIELAAIEVDTRGLVVGEIVNQRYSPDDEISLGAMAVHHILPSDLEGMPSCREAVLPDCEYVIGHNVDYDWQAVGSPSAKRICTLALARRIWPQLDTHTVTALAYHLLGANDSTRDRVRAAHCAMADVLLTLDILRAIIAHFESRDYAIDSFEKLWNASEKSRVPTHFTFGKHKGEAIGDVPASYRSWLLSQPNVDPYLAKAIDSSLGR